MIRNGIDTDQYRPDRGTDVLEAYGVDPDPALGDLRRPHHPPEGRAHLLDAALALDPAAQLILCAGAPDTPSWAAR